MQLSVKWDKIKYAGTSSQCSNSQYALQSHSTFPCTTYSYSSFLFLSGSGYWFPLKNAKHSHSVVPTRCHPMNHSPPGSSVHGILQAEYWSGLPFPSPGNLPHPGIKPGSPTLEADSLLSEPQGSPDSAKPPLVSLSQSSRLLRNSYVRGYCFSWDEYFGNERMSLLQYCNNSLGQNDLESRIPFPLEPLKIIMEEACHLLAKMD